MTYDLHDLQRRIGETNAANGFSEYADIPDEGKVRYIIEKLWLVGSELTEAGEELREGHGINETYFNEPQLPLSLVAEVGVEKARELILKDNEGKLQKPEGFPSEIADAIIRLLHLAEETKIDLEEEIERKLAYNATRGFKHGGKQF